MLRTFSLLLKPCAYVQRTFATILNNKITFTPSCIKKLKEIGEDNGLLRVIVDSGGCSGFQYKYEVDTTLNNDDFIIENSGVRVVVDSQSMQFIEGSKLDYEEELIRSGFRIQNNPQSEKGCSCGSSFALKLD